MIADHFVTGVGRENFGRNYTLYKDIASPEEVANPHNVLVQAMAEWGVLGLFALILMLIGVTRKAASRPIECNVADREESRIHEPAWAAALGLAVIALRSMLLGSADANYIYYSAVTTAMVWLPVFLIFTRLGARSLAPAALVAGLAAFLAQDAISFAFFTPAAAVTFFAVLGVWLSGRSSQEMPGPSFLHTPRWALPVALAAVTLLVAATLIAPVVRARSGLRQADQHTRDGRFSEADLVFARAQRADPLDSTPWLEHARALVERATVPSLETAVARLHEAKRRDPRLIIIHRNESLIRSALATMTGRPEHYHGAIDAARSALALYPQDPQGLVRLADTQATAGRALGDEELLRIAAEHYRQALSLDEKRLEWETIQRFRPRVVEEIRSKIAEIEAWRTR
jgi:tetratricopeptide (TPR) repeat protein